MSVDVGSPEWNEGKEKSKFKDTPEFGTTEVGRIFLQDHNSKVWFKNLYIQKKDRIHLLMNRRRLVWLHLNHHFSLQKKKMITEIIA